MFRVLVAAVLALTTLAAIPAPLLAGSRTIDLSSYATAIRNYYDGDLQALNGILTDPKALQRFKAVRDDMHGIEKSGVRVSGITVGLTITSKTPLGDGKYRIEATESIGFVCTDRTGQTINSRCAQPHTMIVQVVNGKLTVAQDDFDPWPMPDSDKASPFWEVISGSTIAMLLAFIVAVALLSVRFRQKFTIAPEPTPRRSSSPPASRLS